LPSWCCKINLGEIISFGKTLTWRLLSRWH
jgi:hypothetical protein